jgi:hypothetical protein
MLQLPRDVAIRARRYPQPVRALVARAFVEEEEWPRLRVPAATLVEQPRDDREEKPRWTRADDEGRDAWHAALYRSRATGSGSTLVDAIEPSGL